MNKKSYVFITISLILLIIIITFLKEITSNNYLVCTPNESLNNYINRSKWQIKEVINHSRLLTLAGPGDAEQQFYVECYQLIRGKEQINQYMFTSPATRTIKSVFYVMNLDYRPRQIPDLRNSVRRYLGKVTKTEYVLSIDPVGPMGDVVTYCYLEGDRDKFQSVTTTMHQLYFVLDDIIIYVISEMKLEKDDILLVLPDLKQI